MNIKNKVDQLYDLPPRVPGAQVGQPAGPQPQAGPQAQPNTQAQAGLQGQDGQGGDGPQAAPIIPAGQRAAAAADPPGQEEREQDSNSIANRLLISAITLPQLFAYYSDYICYTLHKGITAAVLNKITICCGAQ